MDPTILAMTLSHVKMCAMNINTLQSRLDPGARVTTIKPTLLSMDSRLVAEQEVMGAILSTREFPLRLQALSGVLTKIPLKLPCERVPRSTATPPKNADLPVLSSSFLLSRTRADAPVTTTLLTPPSMASPSVAKQVEPTATLSTNRGPITNCDLFKL